MEWKFWHPCTLECASNRFQMCFGLKRCNARWTSLVTCGLASAYNRISEWHMIKMACCWVENSQTLLRSVHWACMIPEALLSASGIMLSPDVLNKPHVSACIHPESAIFCMCWVGFRHMVSIPTSSSSQFRSLMCIEATSGGGLDKTSFNVQ